MGEYANVKRNDIKRLLIQLANKYQHLTFSSGGKHQLVVRYSFWERPYPIPFKHREVNKHTVKKLMEKLVKSDICTKEEFDSLL